MKYAAYDANSIYAVSATAEGAIANARRDCKDDSTQFDVAPIDDVLFYKILADGWNGNRQSFEFDKDGVIFETTHV